jgi:hypothetical protein
MGVGGSMPFLTSMGGEEIPMEEEMVPCCTGFERRGWIAQWHRREISGEHQVGRIVEVA